MPPFAFDALLVGQEVDDRAFGKYYGWFWGRFDQWDAQFVNGYGHGFLAVMKFAAIELAFAAIGGLIPSAIKWIARLRHAPLVAKLTGWLSRLGGRRTFYRAVSGDELKDILEVGRFRTGGVRSAEGKYFTDTVESAAEWGRRIGSPHIVQTTALKTTIGKMTLVGENVDGIGRAWFAPENILNEFSRPQKLPWHR